MIAVGHTSVGVLMGLAGAAVLPESVPLWGQVLLVGVAGVASHYVMDMMPHGHYEFDSKRPSQQENLTLLNDLLVPIVVVGLLLLWRHGVDATSWLVAAGVVGAQLPDVFDGLLARGTIPPFGWARREHAFHSWTHWHNPKDSAKATSQGGRRLGWSDAWQAIVGLVALVCLLKL